MSVRELLLEDDSGNVRARLRVSEKGRPVVEVLDDHGQPLRAIDLLEAVAAPEPGKAKASLRREDTLEEWQDRIHQEVLATQGKPANAYKLYIDFMENYHAASGKYINEVLTVSGEVVDVQNKGFGDVHVGLKGLSQFQPEVLCHFRESDAPLVEQLKAGQRVKIRGKCTEYVNKRVKLWGCTVVESS
jgi:hypothetical protein